MAFYHYFAASSSDFEESLQAVRFSYKQSTATVYIKINDDDRVEDTEAFQVELLISRDLYSRGVQFGKPAKAKVFIKDGTQVYKISFLQSLCVLYMTFR